MATKSAKDRRKPLRKKLVLLIFVFIAFVTASGCGNPEIELTGYESQTVTFVGISDGKNGDAQVTLTIEELKELDCITVKTNSTSDKIGEVRATGPLLETIVDKYGASMADFRKIIITATDGYEIVLNQPFISENKLILAYGINGKPLGEDEKPIRLIVPESDSAYWIRMIESIEFIT